MGENNAVFLEMINISKSFPGVKALDKVNFKLKKGTVHALMGENGAGKSTLMKILAGIKKEDEGQIILNNSPVEFHNPRDSIKKGISMIHQELNPVLEMTVAENLYLGREFHHKGNVIINSFKMYNAAKELLGSIGLNIDPNKKMRDLTVAQMQMVEIAKALDYNADIIIMDEPTSAITDREVDKLFELIHQLKTQGKCIIYITHKMDEVFRIADEITVFRDGQYIGTYSSSEITEDELIKAMVNRELKDFFPEKTNKPGEIKLKVENLTRNGIFKNVSFEVKKGEVVGLAGLMGAGRTEVVESIFGITKLDEGEVYIDNKKINLKHPKSAISNSIGLVTEDRKRSGLVLSMNVKDNATLPATPRISKGTLILNKNKEIELTNDYVEKLRIKTPSISQIINNLSGGNQQKVVLAKWLMLSPEVLIFDEPTRGIDIGAKTEIYKLINNLAEQGIAIIFISSEMQEILGMCDRIIVFHEGKISGEINRCEADQEKILKLATGIVNKEEACING